MFLDLPIINLTNNMHDGVLIVWGWGGYLFYARYNSSRQLALL
jgi:hypothetical protein